MIDIMTQKDTPLYFMSAHKFHPEIDQYVKEVYIPRRKKMKTKCQMIMTSHDKSKKYAKVNPQVYEWVGFIPSNTYPLESTIVIYDDVVQFQACCGENPSGVLIENAYLAKTMLAVFMLLRNAGRVVKHSL
jgi:hypothetical protein